MNLQQIPLVEIKPHWELNRKPNDAHVFGLAGHMDANGYDKTYPLRVVVVDDVKHLAAGHHRYAASQLTDILFPNLPLTEVWAEITEGTMEDVFRILHEDNFKHDPGVNPAVGLPLSRAEKSTQCQALLLFPDVFRQSNRALGTAWAVHHSTVADWRKAVSVGIRQMAAANLDAETLLSDFSITPERLATMLELIESGEREVTRGGTTFTQKTVDSDTRRADERETAIENFRTMKKGVDVRLDAIVETYPQLKKSTLHRRLYQAFGLNHAGNASRWPTPKVREEAETLQKLFSALDPDNRDALWLKEFMNINTVREVAGTLIEMGPPYEKPEVQPFLDKVNHIATADWESLDIDARREYLQNIAWNAHSLPIAEQKVRDGKEAKAAAAEKAAALDAARADAAAGCTRLVETWHVSPCEDKTQDGYRLFIIAACDRGGYSSERLFPAEFLKPSELPDAAACERIRQLADRICQDLASEEPPYWIQQFFPEPETSESTQSEGFIPPRGRDAAATDFDAAVNEAVTACNELHAVFKTSKVLKKDKMGHYMFLRAACETGQYAPISIYPSAFTTPADVIANTQYAHAIRKAADRIREDLAPENPCPPAWMSPFLEASTDSPEPAAMHPNAVADACRRLKDGFLASAVVDKSDDGYREFIEAACAEDSTSDKTLMPASFLDAEQLGLDAHTEYGGEIQRVAITLLAELDGEPYPTWMYPFMELETETSSKGETPEVETPQVAPALNHNAVRTIRDATNAIGSVLPFSARAMPSVVAIVEQHVTQLTKNPVERLDVLRAVLLQTLRQL